MHFDTLCTTYIIVMGAHTQTYTYTCLYMYIFRDTGLHTHIHLIQCIVMLYIYISTYDITYIHMFQVHGPPSLPFPLVLCGMVGGWISPFFCGTVGDHFQKC